MPTSPPIELEKLLLNARFSWTIPCEGKPVTESTTRKHLGAAVLLLVIFKTLLTLLKTAWYRLQ